VFSRLRLLDQSEWAVVFMPTPQLFSYSMARTSVLLNEVSWIFSPRQERIQDFTLRGEHFKKLCRAEEGAKMFGVFRVKNHDFTPKNIFFQF
jgi:hypothetical protein